MAAVTPLLLAWLGSVAVLATLGLFYQFGDRWTQVLVEFTASVLWGAFGISAMDVYVVTDVNPPVGETIRPLMILGFLFAIATFAYALYDIAQGTGEAAKEVGIEDLGGP